jgi:hypothetical protein
MGAKEKLKNKYELSNKIILSTFGLIIENKNIETTLFALKEVVIKHPEVVYFIIGKTHPEVIRQEGKYRNLLISTVKELNLEKQRCVHK